MEKLSIIIPAYNEEKRIGGTLEEYGKFFTRLKKTNKLDSEILIVINNTQDRTEEIVKKYQKKYKIIKSLNLKQGGKGFAIIEGFKKVLKNPEDGLIGFFYADIATSPEAFYNLVKNINGFDGIIASRYISGAKVNPRQTWKRIFVSRIFNFLIRALFLMNYRDTQCGAKVFKHNVLQKVIEKLTVTKYAFDVDLLYHLEKKGFKIKEFPTVWSDRKYSKVNFLKAGPFMALGVIRIRIFNSPFKKFVRIYDNIFANFKRFKQ